MRASRRSASQRRRVALRFSAAASVVLLAACGGEPSAASNVVLVLVDQLRKDAADRWMPEVRGLATRGVVFEQMRAAAPWTYPSVISLFSGLDPQQHGADGHPRHGKVLSTFDERLPLLPGLLEDTHYRAGFVTSPFLQKWNPFHQGFDHYAIDEFIGDQGPLRGHPEAVWTKNMFADRVNATIFAHFEERRRSRPEFVYVHYIDVHGGGKRGGKSGPWASAPFEVSDASYGGYADATHYVDQRVRDLYEYFMARYDGDLVFIVTSDHGQELSGDLESGDGRRARVRKATVHDFNIRIPFLILPSEVVSEPRVIEAPVSNIDVMPTVLEWIGIAPPSHIRGQSLLPLIRGQPNTSLEQRPVYSRMSAFGRMNDCVVVGSRKYLRHLDPETGQVLRRSVFDLDRDPRETTVVGRDFSERALVLRALAGTGGVEYEKRFSEPEAEVLDRLKALGYFVDGSASPDPQRAR